MKSEWRMIFKDSIANSQLAELCHEGFDCNRGYVCFSNGETIRLEDLRNKSSITAIEQEQKETVEMVVFTDY